MRICVTGNDGYLGSLLAPELMRAGHEVLGLDTGFYKERILCPTGPLAPKTLVKDIRKVEPMDLHGVDAIVHMAELSNDPTGQLAPHITHEINHQGVAVVLTAHDLNWVAAHLPWAVCINHRLIAEGRPNEIFNAEVLREAYSGELVVFHQDGMVMIGERPHAPHI